MTSFILLLLAYCLGCVVCWPATPDALDNAEHHFEKFIQEYNRNYVDEYKKQARFEIFKRNLEKAVYMNNKGNKAVYGISQFMDLSPKEFESEYICCSPKNGEDDHEFVCPILTDADVHGNDAPESFDWRDHNVVTSVKTEKRTIIAFYEFASAGHIESQYAIKHKKLISLSAQQIADCDIENAFCGRGFLDEVYRSLMKQGGIVSDEDYPYEGFTGNCRFEPSKVVVKLTDCHNYNLTSQEKFYCFRGDVLQVYRKGIVADDDCVTGRRTSNVLLVGYGVENDEPYWIAKNSWGEDWGEKGYFRIHRGEGADSCGMMNPFMAVADIE